MPGRALAACGGPCAQRGSARARLSCREAPSLNADIGPRAFRVVPSRGGTGHPTLDRAEHLCPLASATNPATVCRFFEPRYGPQEPQRVAAREFKESDAREQSKSHRRFESTHLRSSLTVVGGNNFYAASDLPNVPEALRFEAQS